ncbi:fibronectin type III domain-containing protein, partial [Candidatus Dojkabacteria bacterium]|nr:fibronectin type III domain-containing protein [Candidatus Dojkabacteria bacterium]
VTDRSSDSRVEYGLSSGNYFGEEVGSSDQVTDHQVELSSLTAGTTYYYHVKWTDEDGNTGVSTEKVFSTNPAPLVKGITPIRVDLTSALVRFTSTGASRIRVLYGKSTGFGGVQEIQTSPVESTYTVVLDGLDDGTTYYYKIDPVDSEGFEYEGSVLDFTTLPRPKISNVQIQEVKGTAQPTVEISWETNTEVSSILSYFPTDNPSLTREAVDLELVAGDHAMQITGLQASTTYSLIVRGLDKLGNEGASVVLNFTTATDSRPPAISNLVVKGDIVTTAVSGEGQAQLIVTWDTDEPATSQVEFSVGSVGEYTQRTQADANLTYNHLVVVSNLTPSQVYHLRVVSSDSSFNQAESGDTVTITPKLADSAFELVINNLLQIFGFLGT